MGKTIYCAFSCLVRYCMLECHDFCVVCGHRAKGSEEALRPLFTKRDLLDLLFKRFFDAYILVGVNEFSLKPITQKHKTHWKKLLSDHDTGKNLRKTKDKMWSCGVFLAVTTIASTSIAMSAFAATDQESLEQQQDPWHSCGEVLANAKEKNGYLFLGSSKIELCAAPAHTCDFAVSGARSSCQEVCQQQASGDGYILKCVNAWDDLNDDGLCPPGPAVSCDRQLGSKVCSCGRLECNDHEDCRLNDNSTKERMMCFDGHCRREMDCDFDDDDNTTKMGCRPSEPIALADIQSRQAQQRPGRSFPTRVVQAAPDSAHMCELVSREMLTEADPRTDQLAVHRLRFAIPHGAKVEGSPPFHVKVRAPDEQGQRMRVRAYSAELEMNRDDASFVATNSDDKYTSFALTVKIYPGGPPKNRGTSAYLGNVTVGEKVHVPEIRSLGWTQPPSTIRKVGMVAFGVGIAEMLEPLKMILSTSPEANIRLVYAGRNEGQKLYMDELHDLLAEHRGRFSLLHCLSRQKESETVESGECVEGENTHYGRLDNIILEKQFGDGWANPTDSHFLVIGTREMENSIYSWLRRKGLGKTLFTGAMWQPFVPAQAADQEKARMEAFSASSVYGTA
jgi:ferredoxin-NADP reductase